jgi:hypothetical protein
MTSASLTVTVPDAARRAHASVTQALEEEFNSPWNRFKRFVSDHPAVLSLGIAAIAWLIVFMLWVLARERDAGVPEYLTEPPDDAGPALAYGIAKEGNDRTLVVTALVGVTPAAATSSCVA